MSKSKHYDSLDLGSLLKTPGYGSGSPLNVSADPITRQKITVTLDQLRPFAMNPRQSRNPLFDDIKESIRQRGLDAPPPVSRRPGEDHYIIVNGGNTRLAILNELWEETRDRQYFEIEVDFVPWKSDAHALTGHLIENDARGEMTFIDRAMAILQLKQLWESEQPEAVPLSQRELARRLTEAGYKVSQTMVNRIIFTLEYLAPNIPSVLNAGLGKPQIERLIKLRNACEEGWKTLAPERNIYEFAIAFDLALSACDRYADDWNYDMAQDDILRHLAGHLDTAYGELLVAVEQALYQGSRQPMTSGVDPAPMAAVATGNTREAADGASSAAPVTASPAPTASRAPAAKAATPPRGATPAQTPEAPVTDIHPLALLTEHVAILVEDRVDPLPVLAEVRERLISLVMQGANACALPEGLLVRDDNSPVGFAVRQPAHEMTVEQTRFWWLLRLITEPTDTTPNGMIQLTSETPWANPLMLLFPESGWAAMASAAALEVLVLARRCRAEWVPAQ